MSTTKALITATMFRVGQSLSRKNTSVGIEVSKVKSINDNGSLSMDNGNTWHPTVDEIF